MRNRQINDLYDLFILFVLATQISKSDFAYFNSSGSLGNTPKVTKECKACAAKAIQLKNTILEQGHWPQNNLLMLNRLRQELVKKEKGSSEDKFAKLDRFLEQFVEELYKTHPFENLNIAAIDEPDTKAFASQTKWHKFALASSPKVHSDTDKERSCIQNETEEKQLRVQNALASFRQTAISTLNEYKNAGRRNWLGRLFGMDPANKKMADSLHHSIETIIGNKTSAADKFIAINAQLYEKGSELQKKKSKRLFPLLRSIHQQLIQEVKNTGDKLIIDVVMRNNDHLRMHHPKRRK